MVNFDESFTERQQFQSYLNLPRIQKLGESLLPNLLTLAKLADSALSFHVIVRGFLKFAPTLCLHAYTYLPFSHFYVLATLDFHSNSNESLQWILFLVCACACLLSASVFYDLYGYCAA